MALKQLLIDQGDLFRQRLIEPDYTLPQDTNTAPLITKRLLRVEEELNSGLRSGIDNISDNFIRGGAILAAERTLDDTKRITKFLLTGEGISFIAKEAAIQRTNPQSLISPTNRTRTPVNLLAQIPANLVGINVRRDGLLDTVFESNFNYDSERGGKRRNKKYEGQFRNILKTDAALLGGGRIDDIGRLEESDQDHTILGIYNDFSIGSGFPARQRENRGKFVSIGAKNDIKEYSGGAGSIFGIGRTTIKRYTDSNELFEKSKDEIRDDFIPSERTRQRFAKRDTYNLGDPGTKGYSPEAKNYSVVLKSITQDKLNLVDELPRENQNDADLVGLKDFIKFRIALVDTSFPLNDEVLLFRAFLESLNDNFKGDWNSFQYNGRAENFYSYSGFDRDISFSFKIAAQTAEELKPLYRKLNLLVGTTAPEYANRRMRGRFCRLTIGDWCYELPGFFQSVGLQWQKNYAWELDEAPNHFDPQYPVSQHPHVLDVNCSFKPIHDFTPENLVDKPFIIRVKGQKPPKQLQKVNESPAGFSEDTFTPTRPNLTTPPDETLADDSAAALLVPDGG